jgi:transcriptional regulator with XRE-family HTH domain
MDWRAADLARATGISKQNLTNWMNAHAGSTHIAPRFAFAIQDATRFNARWVLYGEGPARIDVADPLDSRILDALKSLPDERKRALLLALGFPSAQ